MIITLKGADFSSNNIGTLSTWTIFTTLGTGATYSGVRTVDKDGSLTATVTIAEGYELSSAGLTVMMGSTNVTSSVVTSSGNVYTISISSVTANVTISVPTKNTSTGEEGGGDVVEPDTPTDKTVTYIFKDSDWTKGYYTTNGPSSPTSASHGYLTIPADGIYSITVNPQAVGASGGLYYLIHVDGTGKTTTYWDIKDGITVGDNTQVFNGTATGTFYINCFDVQKDSTAVYATQATIVYV